MSGVLALVEIEKCLRALEEIESSLMIKGGNVERPPWQKEGKREEVVVLLKSLRFPSLDETPLIAAVIDSLADNPEVKRVEVYEYETTEGEMGRSERAAAVLETAVRRGSGIIAITPSLLGISLVSKLAERVAEELEKSIVANVSVRFENSLYLPEPEYSKSIEVLAKKNSKSSYERVSWIKGEARKRGILVRNVLYLEDNKAIISYMSSKGRRSFYECVPITKVSKLVLAMSRCMNLKGIEEVRRVEESSHTIYALDVPESAIDEIIKRIEELLSKPWNPLSHPKISPYIKKGIEEVIESFVEQLAVF